MIEQKIEKGLCGYVYFQFYNTYHISFAALSRNKLKEVASGRNWSVAAPFVQRTSLLPFRPPYSVYAIMDSSSSSASQLWGEGGFVLSVPLPGDFLPTSLGTPVHLHGFQSYRLHQVVVQLRAFTRHSLSSLLTLQIILLH